MKRERFQRHRKPLNKKADVMGLSFTTLFSIILIIIFIAVAFYAINAFLSSQKCAQIGMFVDDLRNDVDKAWDSQMTDSEFRGKLPSDLKYACIADLSKSMTSKGLEGDIGYDISVFEGNDVNLFFYPMEKSCSLGQHKINHIDLEKITKERNPHCFPNEGGIVKMRIKKEFNEALASIE